MLLTTIASARAQEAVPVSQAGEAPVPARVQLAIAGLVTGPMRLGSANANLVQPDGSPLPLFATESRFGVGFGTEVHVLTHVSPRAAVEATGSWQRVEAQTAVSQDFEDVASVTIRERLSRFSAEGSFLWSARAATRSELFFRAGGGWMQEVVGVGPSMQRGLVAHIGAGVKYWSFARPSGARGRVGLRIEGRLAMRSGGFILGSDALRLAPVISGGLIVGL
jgi:hypothetical protein